MIESNAGRASLRVAMIGHGLTGVARTRVCRVAQRFFVPLSRPERAVDRDDTDIGSPGDHDAAVALAARGAGQHLLSGEPPTNSVADTAAMAAVARLVPEGAHRRVPPPARAEPAGRAGRRRGVVTWCLGESRRRRRRRAPSRPHAAHRPQERRVSGRLGIGRRGRLRPATSTSSLRRRRPAGPTRLWAPAHPRAEDCSTSTCTAVHRDRR